MDSLRLFHQELQTYANPKKAKLYAGYFKTGKGQYGEGDIFLGLTVPQSRTLAKKYKDLTRKEIEQLLDSKIHEERLISLLILVGKFKKGTKDEQKKIFNFYLSHTKHINNWDLVDLSSHKIVGEYLLDKKRDMLIHLANSQHLWEKRIAIIATAAFINRGEYEDTLEIAEILLQDKQDLIQKAVGWMLREVGKRCSEEVLVSFLAKHYKEMPRTTLRYAIERFPEEKRKQYLQGLI